MRALTTGGPVPEEHGKGEMGAATDREGERGAERLGRGETPQQVSQEDGHEQRHLPPLQSQTEQKEQMQGRNGPAG